MSSCLEDFEVRELVSRLKSWTRDPSAEDTIEFTEPMLTFRKLPTAGEVLDLRVGFDSAAHPDKRHFSEDPFWVPFVLSRGLLSAFAVELSGEFAKVAR